VPGLSRENLPGLVEMRNSGFTVAVMTIANEESYAETRGMLEAEGIMPMQVRSEEELGALTL
jgi:DNA-binding GntR family transcriptional regulator